MAGPIQTPFTEPAMGSFGPEGDLGMNRDTDPNTLNADNGTSAVIDFWTTDQTVESPQNSETMNSVSGMPQTPTRFYPAPAEPPPPPDLTDRNPGTIDQK
jgi:hypothetical protein